MKISETQRRSEERIRDVALWRGVQRELGLSDRQIQVAILLVVGLTIREIAARMAISRWTVNTYYGRIKLRLGVHNKAEVVLSLLHKSGLLLAGD